MTEIINEFISQIAQIIFWLKMVVYLIFGICVV